MSGGLSQDKRIAVLSTPLGRDVLVLARFEGSEGLSELFEYRIEALSEQENIDFDRAVGRNCSVKFSSYDGAERFFNGVLTEAQWLGVRGAYYAYRLVLRPWLWLLSNTADSKIYDKMTPPDIIKKVFSDGGFTDFQLKLTEGYPTLEYCVQYRQTDLAFVSRLMEQYGIYYFFEHSSDKHTLVLADSKSSHSPVPGVDKIPYIPLTDSDRRKEEHLYQWASERRFRTGKVTLNEYDYKQPSARLLVEQKASERYNKADLEVYDYPGQYEKRNDGEKLAKVRLEADQAQDHRRRASGDAVSLFPGGLTRLQDHPASSENVQHLVVRASHSYTAEHYRSGGSGSGEPYFGNYEFLPSDRPYRAPLITPRPLVHGPHTAKVVGKEGEEIDVDELGRITVQFHWDRDRKPSRRVRVAQMWSGKQWGWQVIPRIGQEVVVEFLEGDPDRPLVTGTVYNAEYKYPYELPSNKTQSGVKSDSTKGGGGYNEFMFEDKKEEEFVRLHAEKDYKVKVRNKETREIGDKFKTPQGSASRETTLRNGDDNLTVEKGDQNVDVAQTINITAGKKIELTVGSSKITMDPQSITLQAMQIKVTGTATVAIEAPMTDVTGTGILTLQGALVKIG
jgi:type VI secretion system secreted protein VgrG